MFVRFLQGLLLHRHAEGKLKVIQRHLGAFNQPGNAGRPIVLEELHPTNSAFDQPDRFV